MAFKVKIQKARFVVGPFSSEHMETIGIALANSIRSRIRAGVNAEDNPAKPLKSKGPRGGYAGWKARLGLNPLRDWTVRGRTLRSLQVKTVSENRGVIGFTDDQSDRIAHINNLREKAFGVSPNDHQVFLEAVRQIFREKKIVRTEKIA
jgi:hypothetical protein